MLGLILSPNHYPFASIGDSALVFQLQLPLLGSNHGTKHSFDMLPAQSILTVWGCLRSNLQHSHHSMPWELEDSSHSGFGNLIEETGYFTRKLQFWWLVVLIILKRIRLLIWAAWFWPFSSHSSLLLIVEFWYRNPFNSVDSLVELIYHAGVELTSEESQG